MKISKEEISEAYSNLVWAQGLIDYVLQTDNDGTVLSIFNILAKMLKGTENILYELEGET